MGEVVYLPASRHAAEQRRGSFHDPESWRVSRKGNLWLRTTEGHCVTIYPSFGGFRFCIAATARDRPVFSREVYDSEQEARQAAWQALSATMEESA